MEGGGACCVSGITAPVQTCETGRQGRPLAGCYCSPASSSLQSNNSVWTPGRRSSVSVPFLALTSSNETKQLQPFCLPRFLNMLVDVWPRVPRSKDLCPQGPGPATRNGLFQAVRKTKLTKLLTQGSTFTHFLGLPGSPCLP